MNVRAALDLLRETNACIAAYCRRYGGSMVEGTQVEIEALQELEAKLRQIAELISAGISRSPDPVVSSD